MRLIRYGLLAFGLMLTAACGKAPTEPAAESAPATVAAPASEDAATPAATGDAMTPSPAQGGPFATESDSAAACPTGCVYMNCPPPNGTPQCCKKTPTGYQACTL